MLSKRRFPLLFLFLLCFIIFAVSEVALLFWLAGVTSWPFTILLVILTGIFGTMMAKRAGLSVLARAKAELARGQFPAGPLADGVLILLGGILLLSPGLITDVIGMTTLVPACRRVYAKLLLGWAKRIFKFVQAVPTGMFTGGAPFGGGARAPEGEIFDAEPGSYRSETRTDDQRVVDVEFKRTE